MAKHYTQKPMTALKGETIVEITHGNPLMDRLNPYNGYTIKTESGREFVVWNSYGETCLNEIVE